MVKSKKIPKDSKYYLEFWVHPKQGSDYMMYMYLKRKPTKTWIRKYIKSKGSMILDDYRLKKVK